MLDHLWTWLAFLKDFEKVKQISGRNTAFPAGIPQEYSRTAPIPASGAAQLSFPKDMQPEAPLPFPGLFDSPPA
ncbi:hypothetical protein [Desulfonatronum thioautotrophicum]|uniref:hypothetical protein n=1 Tax=Desulfonatronum thioautotrophicum TaxID=617001 RepID=UPI00129477AC|nr:hypothetical protein [Desulfonatronum thioautotrophicum]